MASEYTERDAGEVKAVLEGTEKQLDRGEIKAGDRAEDHVFPAKYFAKKEDEKIEE